ncbi:MAG: hypothetical protein ACKOCM_07390 [Cyanobacteriota bacterium]
MVTAAVMEGDRLGDSLRRRATPSKAEAIRQERCRMDVGPCRPGSTAPAAVHQCLVFVAERPGGPSDPDSLVGATVHQILVLLLNRFVLI